jgi:hypothetical protein
METYVNEKICDKMHKAIDAKLIQHEKQIDEHDVKIDTLVRSDAANTIEIKNLCKQISDLVTTIKWLIGILVTSLGGFFIWVIQQKLN